MSAEALLSRLDRVRKTGSGRWLARCPAHDDSNPSLSIREIDDGTLLINDFGGCATSDVLAAVGLDLHALFPKRAHDHRSQPERRPFHAEDVLRALKTETQIAAIVCARIAYGYEVDWDEYDRLMVAIGRIANAATIAGVDHEERQVRERLQRIRQMAEAA